MSKKTSADGPRLRRKGGGHASKTKRETKRSRLMTILYIRISLSLSNPYLSFFFSSILLCTGRRGRVPLGPLSVIAFLNSMLVAPRKNFPSKMHPRKKEGLTLEGLTRGKKRRGIFLFQLSTLGVEYENQGRWNRRKELFKRRKFLPNVLITR